MEGSLAAARGALFALACAALGCAGAPEPPEILLLVSVDTLRADHLGAFGADPSVTPALDALARESTVFTAAYAPASFTLPSVAALLTGRYPEELGISSNESAVPDSVPTLASALRERGWRTAAVVSNFVLRRACGLAAGFDVYDDAFSVVEATRRWPEREGSRTTDDALRTLDGCTDLPDVRCFLWVHYQDPHGPYTPPPEERERFLEAQRSTPEGRRRLPVKEDHTGVGGIPRYQYLQGRRDVAFYRAGYLGEVAHVDAQIGRLLDGLAERGLSERAVVVFAADHGEALGERDYWFAHGELLIDPLVRVPLMIRRPGEPPGRRADLVSLVDVFPTLLTLLTGERPAGAYAGRDLLAGDSGPSESTAYLANLAAGSVRRFGLVEGDFKFVASERDGVWDGALYRRGREGADLAAAAPQIARSMRRRLEAFREGIERRSETPQELSAEDRARLEALGYATSEPDE